MPFPEFTHFPLRLVTPEFASGLTDLIIDLENLRQKEVHSGTNPVVFDQMVSLFHTIESVHSARIEGNHTTFLELLEAEPTGSISPSEGVKEIRNMERVLEEVEANPYDRLDDAYVKRIHFLVMEGLRPPPHGDGDHRAGSYRDEEVGIAHSSHLPPPPWEIPRLMQELFDFMNRSLSRKYDLIRIAQFHHRFVWIHPFSNGNGRTARILTYAILHRFGYIMKGRRILDPAAVFNQDRMAYYRALSDADKGEPDGMERWCSYMLQGLKTQMIHMDRLSDHAYLVDRLFSPAIRDCLEQRQVSSLQRDMLVITAKKSLATAEDFHSLFQGKHSQEVSRQIRQLRTLGFIRPLVKGGRQYVLDLQNKHLRQALLRSLDREGFLPE